MENPVEGEPKLEDSARREPVLQDLVRVTEANDSTERAATASHASVRQSTSDTVVDTSVDSTRDMEQSTFRNMQSLPDMIIAEHSTHSPFEDGRQVHSVDNLPPFSRASSKSFTWGDHSGEEVAVLLQDVYDEIVHWRPNIFDIPLGASGKKFVDETTRLLTAVAEASALETVGLLAIMVMPALLLQQPASSATHSQRVACLERRLSLWLEGKFDDLLLEGRVLQTQLKRHVDRRSTNRNDIDSSSDAINARLYGQLLSRGKVKSAMHLVSDKGRGRILTLDETVPSGGVQNATVRDVLKAKHPPAAPVDLEALLTDTPPPTHPVIFDQLDGESIQLAALHSQGSAGPSGLDSANWRRLCTMYRGQSRRLCTAMSMLAKRLCTSYIDPAVLQPFVACRLIPLSKNPGVRPIGICETLRRIIGKAIMRVVGPEIQSVVGVSQLCVRQKSGCEAAVHAMRRLFIDENTEGLLLVDASNAFNSLNRQVMLQNIQILCPSFAPCVINHYRGSAKLFVGGETVLSLEGTTQGDPLSMAIYALGTLPLIRRADTAKCTQSWFADDAGAGGRLCDLFTWWKTLEEKGPMYGYHVNPPKTWLLVKDQQHYSTATDMFAGTNISITMEGRPLLGAPIGPDGFCETFCENKVSQWIFEVKKLAKFASTQPHAAFSGYTHGFASKWSYLSRTHAGLETHLQSLEQATRCEFLPAVTGRHLSDVERGLLGLPARLGGIGMPNPAREARQAYKASIKITEPLTKQLLKTSSSSVEEAFSEQLHATINVRRERNLELKQRADLLLAELPTRMQEAMKAAQDRGASLWLTVLPLVDHGFSLSKSDFKDALSLRYGWTPPRLPSHCSCGHAFSIDHALSCSSGGYLSLRHNEVRDVLAEVMSETCCNVQVEPMLQPLSGERFRSAAAVTADEARVDIKAGGFWNKNRQECAYFDVRVFYPHASSYRNIPTARVYRRHEQQKRSAYEERIRHVDRGSFTPLVFSSSGGSSPACTTALKRLASLLAEKRDTTYTEAISWLRCRLSFSLLRSSILCLRGSRPVKHRSGLIIQPDLALKEGQAQNHFVS